MLVFLSLRFFLLDLIGAVLTLEIDKMILEHNESVAFWLGSLGG